MRRHRRNRYGNPTPMPKAGWRPRSPAPSIHRTTLEVTPSRRPLTALDLVWGWAGLFDRGRHDPAPHSPRPERDRTPDNVRAVVR